MNDENDQLNHIKSVIETLLFLSEKPTTLDQIKKVFDTVSAAEIKKAIKELSNEYEERKRGTTIVEIAGGYQMFSNPLYVDYAKKFYKTKHKEKLSKPALETLAIIAYKQPVTRGEIELIRGVNSDGVASHLANKELIKIVGRKDVPGRPFLYGTTKQFMEYFGLKSLDDLPDMEEFAEMAEKKEAELANEDGQGDAIPQSEVPMNSLEQMKQTAIAEGGDEEGEQPQEGEAQETPSETSEELINESEQTATATLEEENDEEEKE